MPTQRTQYPQARPISNKDSADKFPNRQTYPNGTYASTGAIGGTGSFGANLPTRNTSYNPYAGMRPQASSVGNAIGQIVTAPFGNPFAYNPYDQTARGTNRGGAYVAPSPYAAPVAQGSFVSGGGQVNLQGQIAGGRGNMIPTAQDRINASLQNQFTVQQPSIRPQGVYTGDPTNNPNDAAWVNYWNYQAANPGPKAPPQVMTRDQIWNMKAQARRRRQAEREQDQWQEQGQVKAKPEPAYQPFFTKTVGFRTGTG